MKVLIEIPDNAYEWINEHKGVTDFKTTEMLYNRVQNAIPLNGTNGEMFLLTHSNVVADIVKKRGNLFDVVLLKHKGDILPFAEVWLDWWNADYKGVE